MSSEVVNLAKRYVALKNEIDELGRKKAELQKEFDRVRNQLLPDVMDSIGVSSIRIPDVGRVALYDDVRVGVLASKRELAHQWMRSTGNGESFRQRDVEIGRRPT